MGIIELEHEKYLKSLQKKNSILVCVRFSDKKLFSDNLIGACDECKSAIQFRPYNQIASKKLCVECASKLGNKKIKNLSSKKSFEEIFKKLTKEKFVGG